MLRRPEFNSKELDPDLHKRMQVIIIMQQAVQDGRIKCFNLQEGPAEGDQDLDLWTRELEDVVRSCLQGQPKLVPLAIPLSIIVHIPLGHRPRGEHSIKSHKKVSSESLW